MSGQEAPARLAGAIDLLPDAFVMLEASPTRRWGAPVVRHHNAAAAAVLGLREGADGWALDDVCDRTWAARLTDAARRAGTSAVRHRVHDHGPDGEGWLASYDVTAVVAGRDPDCVLVVVHDVTGDELVRRRLHDERSVAEHRASHDDLTGLPNRRTVRRELRRMLAFCDPARSVGVVFVDLDGFKAVNDRHGHAAGDDVLVTVARRLPRVAGAGFLVGRYGGDEFVLAGPDLPGAWSPAALLADLADALCRPVRVQGSAVQGSAVQVRASLGAHVARPSVRAEDRDPLHVVAAADAAMYRQKATRGAGDAAPDG